MRWQSSSGLQAAIAVCNFFEALTRLQTIYFMILS
jgi:hypothetical protein